MNPAFFNLRGGISKFFQSPANVWLTKNLSIQSLRIYIHAIGFLYFLFKKDTARTIQTGQNHFLKSRNINSKLVHFSILYNTLKGIYEHYLEKLVMGFRPLPKLLSYFDKRLTIKQRDILDDAIKTKGGAILVTGHFGAVEFLPMALYLRGYKVAMICRFKTSELKAGLAERALKKNITLIDADEPGVALKALQEIQKGKILITECDEFKAWRQGLKKINVLNNEVNSDKTLDIFYRKSKVPAVLGIMRRDGKGKYSLCLESLADGEEKISIAESAWNSFGKYIELYPFQWYQWADYTKIILQKNIDAKNVDAKKDIYIPITNSIPISNHSQPC